MSDGYKPIRCAACGKFLGTDDLFAAKCAYTPLSEFSPEILEYTCAPCASRERANG